MAAAPQLDLLDLHHRRPPILSGLLAAVSRGDAYIASNVGNFPTDRHAGKAHPGEVYPDNGGLHAGACV